MWIKLDSILQQKQSHQIQFDNWWNKRKSSHCCQFIQSTNICNKKRTCPHLHVILCSCMRDEQKLREAHHPPRSKFWQVPLNNRTHFEKNAFRNVVAVLHHFSPLCVFVCFQKYRMDMLLTKMRMQTSLKNWVVFDWRKYLLRYKLKTAVANRDKDIDKFAVLASNRGNCVHILSIWNKVSVEKSITWKDE